MSLADDDTQPLPLITESRTVRVRLGLLIGIAGFLVTVSAGGAVWATTMDDRAKQEAESLRRQNNLIEEVRNWARSVDRRLDRIEDHFKTAKAGESDDTARYVP